MALAPDAPAKPLEACGLCTEAWKPQAPDLGGFFDFDKPCCRARDVLYRYVPGTGEQRRLALELIGSWHGAEFRKDVEHFLLQWFPRAQQRVRMRRDIALARGGKPE